jgi:hypothetical protein
MSSIVHYGVGQARHHQIILRSDRSFSIPSSRGNHYLFVLYHHDTKNPESAGEVTAINHQCEKKRVLDLGPFAREASTEQLAQPSSVYSWPGKAGHRLVLVVVEEAGRMVKDFMFQSGEKCILEGWACVCSCS